MVVAYVVVPFPVVPAGRQLTGAERVSTATAEETDIDAVEVPLPGNDILEFSRGVTDLDAVGKDGGSHIDSVVGDFHVWSRCLRASWVTSSGPSVASWFLLWQPQSEVLCHAVAVCKHIHYLLEGSALLGLRSH